MTGIPVSEKVTSLESCLWKRPDDEDIASLMAEDAEDQLGVSISEEVSLSQHANNPRRQRRLQKSLCNTIDPNVLGKDGTCHTSMIEI